MMETGKMTIVVDLVHTVYLRGLDTGRFTLEDGKMTKDTYVSMSFTQCKESFSLCLQYTLKIVRLKNGSELHTLSFAGPPKLLCVVCCQLTVRKKKEKKKEVGSITVQKFKTTPQFSDFYSIAYKRSSLFHKKDLLGIHVQSLCPSYNLLLYAGLIYTILSLNDYLCFICRVMELISTPILNIMKGSGMQTSGVAGEECIIQMGQFMRENGTIT